MCFLNREKQNKHALICSTFYNGIRRSLRVTQNDIHKEILKIMYSICSYVDIVANVSYLSIQYLQMCMRMRIIARLHCCCVKNPLKLLLTNITRSLIF